MTNMRQVAFDHVSSITKANSINDIMQELSLASKNFGYENFCISGLPSPNEKIDSYVMLSGWPQSWMSRYLEKEYVNDDPVIQKTRVTSMPFMWTEALDQKLSSHGKLILNEAIEFGLIDGFSVPIYTTHGFQAIVTFGAKSMTLDADQRSALHLIAIYAHSKVRSLLPDSYNKLDRNTPDLTKRELECLKWSAAGKTAWEVSMILSISERTVEQFLKSAAIKLTASNRTHAVAEAMRRNMIQ